MWIYVWQANYAYLRLYLSYIWSVNTTENLEIERKFLIDAFPDGLELIFRGFVEQGYLCTLPEVRVLDFGSGREGE